MNRQIRREQAKQDKKAAREKQRKRAARRARVQNVRRRRTSERSSGGSKPERASGGGGKASGGKASGGKPPRLPGRFSGVLMIATVFFIVLQAAVPAKDMTTLNSVTGAGFFVLFGYFSLLYLERRGTPRALIMTLVSGLLLVAGVTVARLLEPTLAMDWLMMGLALPGVVAGAYLGRLVFYNSPA